MLFSLCATLEASLRRNHHFQTVCLSLLYVINHADPEHPAWPVRHRALAIAYPNKRADVIVVGLADPRVQVYHSNKQWDIILDTFETNDPARAVVWLDTLSICGKLREGYDCPAISVIAITCNITTFVKFYQLIGRALRVYRGESPSIRALICYNQQLSPKIAHFYRKLMSQRYVPVTIDEAIENYSQGDDEDDDDEAAGEADEY